jgi:hypothetical protein
MGLEARELVQFFWLAFGTSTSGSSTHSSMSDYAYFANYFGVLQLNLQVVTYS